MKSTVTITKDQAIAVFAFVEGVTYKLKEPYDSDSPEYRFAIPFETSNNELVTCWIVNEEGEPSIESPNGELIAQEDLEGVVE